MTKSEKPQVSELLRATEVLLLENIALKPCSSIDKFQIGVGSWIDSSPIGNYWRAFICASGTFTSKLNQATTPQRRCRPSSELFPRARSIEFL